MYQEFYCLKEKPFSLTPDPQFLYLSEGHRTAIDSLLYGIYQREGFMVLTGDIGTGKTTICRAILEKLGKHLMTAVIFNSFLNEGELLKSILQDLGLPSEGRSKKGQIDELNKFLIDQLSKGENVALIIDEAQNLSIPVLEMIRMLSNLETEKEKMIQIILIGQLELDQKLRSPKLKQLNQRVAIRQRLLPLTRMETEFYINHRLTVAGAQGNIIFSRSALNEIYQFSKGFPRLINLLCDRALLAGFVNQTNHIDKEIVKKAKISLIGSEASPESSPLRTFWRHTIPSYIGLLMIIFSLFATILLSGERTKHFIWERIQGIYFQISGASEQAAPKIEAVRSSKDSPKAL
jgi:general secretion pathway protein A